MDKWIYLIDEPARRFWSTIVSSTIPKRIFELRYDSRVNVRGKVKSKKIRNQDINRR